VQRFDVGCPGVRARAVRGAAACAVGALRAQGVSAVIVLMEFEGDEDTRKGEAREPRPRLALLAPLLLFLGACRSLEITPEALRMQGGRPAERAAALARWQAAIELSNEFLESDYRRTLPPGRFELAEDGMRFISVDGPRWSIDVCSSTWGDLVVSCGFRAQEGQDGFCVGSIDQGQIASADALLDNSFFRRGDGEWHDSASLAEVVLHETTHVVHRAGTIGPWNTLGYYLVAIATFSAANHPAENRPRATSEEFAWFCAARRSDPEYRSVIAGVRDEHLARPREHCEHGPFPAR
jgi:hypothetical protein